MPNLSPSLTQTPLSQMLNLSFSHRGLSLSQMLNHHQRMESFNRGCQLHHHAKAFSILSVTVFLNASLFSLLFFFLDVFVFTEVERKMKIYFFSDGENGILAVKFFQCWGWYFHLFGCFLFSVEREMKIEIFAVRFVQEEWKQMSE